MAALSSLPSHTVLGQPCPCAVGMYIIRCWSLILEEKVASKQIPLSDKELASVLGPDILESGCRCFPALGRGCNLASRLSHVERTVTY